MARLFLAMFCTLALLLAPVPAVAFAAPTAEVAATEHCMETGSGTDHRDSDQSQDRAKHPCCKSNLGGCCPVAAPLASAVQPRPCREASLAYGAPAEAFVPGSAGPPLTEPPTLA